MKKYLVFIFLFFFSLTYFRSTTKTSAQTPPTIEVPAVDQIMVQFRPAMSLDERLKFHKTFGTNFIKRFEKLNVDLVNVREKDITKTISEFLKDPRVIDAEPNYIATALETSNDPEVISRSLWGLYKIKAADDGISAWNYSKSSHNIKVAILDTGIDGNHEDLVEKVSDDHNCTDTVDTNDYFGHGTHVAGIVAASTNNGKGVAGVGYNASVMNAKSLGNDGYGYYSWIADCIVWATDNGARVINMSLGGSSPSKILESAINYAWNKGVVIVAAAGNSGSSNPIYPAYYRNVISVAATDKNDKKAGWSSYGRWVSVAAPGVSILSTMPTFKNKIGLLNYGFLSGTSMATPHVSGLAALIWSTTYGVNNSSVRRRIEQTADKITGTGKYWIYGRINALAAVLPVSTYIVPTSNPIKLSVPVITNLRPLSF